jgi:threonine dehydratase
VAAGWHAAPATRVIALVAAGAPAMQRSLAAGQVVETEGVDTSADGLAVGLLAPEAVTMLKSRYDAIVPVSDADIIRAMAMAADRLGLIVEPAGAAAHIARPNYLDRPAIS